MAAAGAAIPYIIAGVGAASSAAGQIQAGRAQAQMAEYNAQVSEQEAAAAKASAAYEEARIRKEGEQLKAKQRARYSKSGIQLNSESSLLVMEDTAADIERDALAIRYGGDVAGARARSQARLDRFQAQQYKTASSYNAVGSLLTGASRAYAAS